MTNEEAISVIKTEIGQFIIDEKWKNALALAISALEKQDVPDKNVRDMISRQAAIDVILADKIDDTSLRVMTALGDSRLALTLNSACDRHIRAIEQLPSAQSKQLQVLASVLDGCPLNQPCDKMWRGGWCEEHCKNNKLQEPDAECWLKYAEVMANENN